MKRLWAWLHKDRSRREIRPFVALAALFFGSILVVALVVTGLRVWVWEPNNAQPAPTGSAPTASQPPTAAPDPSAGGDTTCELDEDDVDISATPPEISTWEVPRFREVPIFGGAGPCLEIGDGASAGFAHTMTGAVQAAFWYSGTLYIESPDASTAALAEYALVPGPVADALLERLADVEAGTWPRADDEESGIGEHIGYRVSYAGDEATVELLMDADGVRWNGVISLRWLDGDWRVVPASPDSWVTGGVVQSTPGYVIFGGR